MIRAAVADAGAAAPAMMPPSQQKIEVLAADHARRRRPVGHARQAARREVLPDVAEALSLDDDEVDEISAALEAEGPGLVSRILDAEIPLPFFGRRS